MGGISVIMALVDFIPVLFFFLAGVILLRDLYNKMVKGAYALLATGTIMVLLGGVCKALWKILYALSICDYPLLSDALFIFQGPGFFLVFLALLGMFTRYNVEHVCACGAVPVYTSNLPFIGFQVVGCGGAQWCLFVVARKMKLNFAAFLYVVSFVFMLGMGYLSATFDDSSNMHWIAQITNIISQGAFFWATILLHKGGLADFKIIDFNLLTERKL